MDREEMDREIQRMRDENARAVAVANHNREIAALVLEAQMVAIKATADSIAGLHQPQKRITVAM